ncbi:MAG: hypothetical protein AAFV25_25340, partial [Bacteroidota bacterium]
LQVKAGTKFLNCSFCGSSLAIKQTGHAIYTEVLDQLKDDTSTLVNQNERMLVEKEIARLDREWMIEREKYKIHGKDGVETYPEGKGGEVFSGVIGLILFGIVASFMLSGVSGMPGGMEDMFVIFIAIAGIVLVGSIISNTSKASGYSKAKSDYEQQRQELLSELEGMEG